MNLPNDVTQVDAVIAEDGSGMIVLIGHTKSNDKTYTANVEPVWMLDGEKVEDKPDAKVLTAFNSPSTPVTSNFVPTK